MSGPVRAEPAPPLSVAIVCKDNQRTIGRTLDSVRGLARQIVAVDSGSTDGTLDLLRAAEARVIGSPWLGHVRTKQLALEACAEPWVLCLDSDESLSAELAGFVRAACAGGAEPGVDGWELRRVVYYRGRPLRHAWQPEWRLRLIRRERFRWAGLDPHDYLEPLGPARLGRAVGVLRHDSFETFAEHLGKQAGHARSMARSLHASGRRGSLARLAISPVGAFLKQVVVKRAFLDGTPGWLAAASTAAGALMKHAVLLELSQPPEQRGAERAGSERGDPG
ncbi:MAG TPA: glycosyltransferase family 2 protein [Phycisphaerales bacterium]|nr:glycosyltransferase family 2 protein [Phycisphaerales bacterium]